jgi:hypothetical protein
VRVAFDAHMVGERESGSETYAANILRALANDPAVRAFTRELRRPVARIF